MICKNCGNQFDVELDSYKKLDDGRYYLLYDFADIGAYGVKSDNKKTEVVAALKEIDGKRFWSIYNVNTVSVIPSDAFEFGGNKYYLYKESLFEVEASQKCQKVGGRLVSIDSKEEQKAITDYIKQMGCSEDVLTNMTYMDNSVYTYSSYPKYKRITLSYQNWADGYPNPSTDISDISLCGVNTHGGANPGEWILSSFSDKNYYICEWETE